MMCMADWPEIKKTVIRQDIGIIRGRELIWLGKKYNLRYNIRNISIGRN